jgi:hypothetical protein
LTGEGYPVTMCWSWRTILKLTAVKLAQIQSKYNELCGWYLDFKKSAVWYVCSLVCDIQSYSFINVLRTNSHIIETNLELDHSEEYYIHMLINTRGGGGYPHKEKPNMKI